ncbi:ATP-binding protein [Desulfonauticus submarinus]
MNFKQELFFLKKIINILIDPEEELFPKMEKSLSLILQKVRAKQGSIMLVEDKKKQANIVAATNKKLIGLNVEIVPETISGYVFSTGEPVYFKDVTKSKRFKHVVRNRNYKTSSLICVPLKRKKTVIGVINASDPEKKEYFSEHDFGLLKDYASMLSPLVENSYLLAQLKQRQAKLEQVSRHLAIKQRELLLASRERSELVQMVVHDFKSPLSAVISNLDLLNYLGLGEEQKHIVDTALDGAKKLLEMINEFLQIARLDAWKETKTELGPMNFLPVVERVVEEFRPLAEEKNIELIVQSAPEVEVYAEENLMYHLLQNLLSNAIKYTPENGKVILGWKIRESRRKSDKFSKFIIFYVEDNGKGIPKGHKELIFRRFKRLKRDVKIQGTGIGLFICQRIVNMWNGKIWVEDVEPTGSRFCFTCYLTGEKNA